MIKFFTSLLLKCNKSKSQVLIQLMSSLLVWPKVITLSSSIVFVINIGTFTGCYLFKRSTLLEFLKNYFKFTKNLMKLAVGFDYFPDFNLKDYLFEELWIVMFSCTWEWYFVCVIFLELPNENFPELERQWVQTKCWFSSFFKKVIHK